MGPRRGRQQRGAGGRSPKSHQTEEMRRRYRHLFPQDKQDAINAVNVLAISGDMQ